MKRRVRIRVLPQRDGLMMIDVLTDSKPGTDLGCGLLTIFPLQAAYLIIALKYALANPAKGRTTYVVVEGTEVTIDDGTKEIKFDIGDKP